MRSGSFAGASSPTGVNSSATPVKCRDTADIGTLAVSDEAVRGAGGLGGSVGRVEAPAGRGDIPAGGGEPTLRTDSDAEGRRGGGTGGREADAGDDDLAAGGATVGS